MIIEQYQQTYISSTTPAVIAASGNLTLHTVNIPKALSGTATFANAAAGTYFVLPAASIGSLQFDCSLPSGLTVTLSAAETVIVTTKQS